MSHIDYSFSIKLWIQGSISVVDFSGMCLLKYAIAFAAWNWIIHKTLILQLANVWGVRYYIEANMSVCRIWITTHYVACILRQSCEQWFPSFIVLLYSGFQRGLSAYRAVNTLHLGYTCTVMYEAKVSVCSNTRIKCLNAMWAACSRCDC